MLGICPDAALVDITHEVTPHDVLEGALELEACRRAFPGGTVFLAVVDPGVGSARRGLAARCGDHRFIAPDNGILSAVFRAVPPSEVLNSRSGGSRAPRSAGHSKAGIGSRLRQPGWRRISA